MIYHKTVMSSTYKCI